MTGSNNPFYGHKHSKDSKQKISENREYKKGHNHHWYGVKGKDHPAYGRKHNEIELEKMSKALKGKAPFEFTEEIRKKISIAHKGNKLSEKHKERISKSNIGKHNYSEATKQQISKKSCRSAYTGKIRQTYLLQEWLSFF